MGVWPDAIGISGTALVIASVVGIALEEKSTEAAIKEQRKLTYPNLQYTMI